MNDQAMVMVEDQSPVISDEALQIIETRSKTFDRVKEIALKSTSTSDWVDQNGKPYLQSSGAEKVARRFGVKISVTAMIRENRYDGSTPHYIYRVEGFAQLGNSEFDRVETFGTCASNDGFFSKRKGTIVPMDEVDEGNIQKAAHTNFMVRAITTLLGLRNLTWDDVKRYGINKDGKTSIDYEANAKAAASAPKAKDSPTGGAWWKSSFNNKDYFLTKNAGELFEHDFLIKCGFKFNEKTGVYSTLFKQDLIEMFQIQEQAKLNEPNMGV